jgi:hypothetical protein
LNLNTTQRCIRNIALLAFTAIASAGCVTSGGFGSTPAPDYATWSSGSPCFGRIGRCFDATFDGQLATPILEKARYEALAVTLKKQSSRLSDVYWELKTPVDGKGVFNVVLKANALGAAPLGELKSEPDLTIYALDGQSIDSEVELKSNESVRVNGNAVVTKQDTITQDFLPPGRYVIGLRYSGTKMFDRKYVYLTVK